MKQAWNVVLTVAVLLLIFGVGPFTELSTYRYILWPGLAWAVAGIAALCVVGIIIQLAIGAIVFAPGKLMQWLVKRPH
jgi:hypothetical protein